jgi:hypothetical protein
MLPRKINKATLENVLIELRNVGLVQKGEGGEEYSIAVKEIEISKAGFINFITNKFSNYTPVLKLDKLTLKAIVKEDITRVLKETFKYDFQERTWEIYSVTLMNWLRFSNHPIRTKIVEAKKGRNFVFTAKLISDKQSFIPRSSLNEILSALRGIYPGTIKVKSAFVRDLQILEVLDTSKQLTEFGLRLVQMSETEQEAALKQKAALLPKVKEVSALLNGDARLRAKDLLDKLPSDFFEGKLKSTKLLYASKVLKWAKVSGDSDIDPN